MGRRSGLGVHKPRRRRGRLTESQQALAAQFVPLALSLVQPFKERWPSIAMEFESSAMLALVQAAESYNAARGVKFERFVRYRIEGSILDVQRRARLRTVSLPEDMEELGVIDPGGESAVDGDEALEIWLGWLSPESAACVRAVYCDGRSLRELGEELGVHPKRLSRLHSRALATLRVLILRSEVARILELCGECNSPGRASV